MVGPYPAARPAAECSARGAAFLGILLVVAGLIAAGCRRSAVLTDLEEIAELQAQFNRDHGKPRIVLLLSPT